jgi:uncharacterized protein (DUF1697 family)
VTTGQTYFAFLRAINTGGRRLTNEQLVEPFLGLGFTEVAAYQAAGNVAFRSDDPAAVDTDRLETALREAYGFAAPAFIRGVDELGAIVAEQPFTEVDLAGTDGRVQISFLRTAPSPETISRIEARVPPEDRVVFTGREWFWLPRRGVGDSQLSVGAIEELTGTMTMRTLGTVSRMLEKFSNRSG